MTTPQNLLNSLPPVLVGAWTAVLRQSAEALQQTADYVDARAAAVPSPTSGSATASAKKEDMWDMTRVYGTEPWTAFELWTILEKKSHFEMVPTFRRVGETLLSAPGAWFSMEELTNGDEELRIKIRSMGGALTRHIKAIYQRDNWPWKAQRGEDFTPRRKAITWYRMSPEVALQWIAAREAMQYGVMPPAGADATTQWLMDRYAARNVTVLEEWPKLTALGLSQLEGDPFGIIDKMNEAGAKNGQPDEEEQQS